MEIMMQIAAFKTPAGLSSFAVSAPSLSAGKKGVTVASDAAKCGDTWAQTCTGGTSVSLSNYSNNGGGPGGRP